MTSAAPRVWIVVSDKAGDNAQVDAVVDRLPWPVEYRRLTFKRPFRKGKPPFFASLYHVDMTQSDALTPPWPDLAITIGRRPAMAAMWIRRQSHDRTRIVLFGRPKRALDHFALVVVSAQFQVPDAPNVVAVTLPLMRVDRERLDRSRRTGAQTSTSAGGRSSLCSSAVRHSHSCSTKAPPASCSSSRVVTAAVQDRCT